MTQGVDALTLAKWQDLQSEIRHLTMQRGLRFVAAAILAPFGAANVGKSAAEGGVSSWAFGSALFLLALAEMAALVQTGLHERERARMEKAHPALAPHGKPNKGARLLGLFSGPGFSTALYALLAGGIIVAATLR